MPFTLACAQFAPKKGNLAANLDRIAELALQALQEGSDLVLFPEACVSGYFLEGGVLDAALEAERLREEVAQRLAPEVSSPLSVALGFYERAGGDMYNAAAFIDVFPGDARLSHVYRKFFLPTYGVFDEERFVSRGRELGVFNSRLGRMGFLICEDVWHSMLPALLAVHGAQLVLVPSASPGRGFAQSEPQNHDRYRRMLRALSEEHGVYAANAQLCGFEGGKGFVGGSMIFDPFGALLAEGPLQEEFLLLADIDFEAVDVARAQSPLLSDLRSSWADLVRIATRPIPGESPR